MSEPEVYRQVSVTGKVFEDCFRCSDGLLWGFEPGSSTPERVYMAGDIHPGEILTLFDFPIDRETSFSEKALDLFIDFLRGHGVNLLVGIFAVYEMIDSLLAGQIDFAIVFGGAAAANICVAYIIFRHLKNVQERVLSDRQMAKRLKEFELKFKED